MKQLLPMTCALLLCWGCAHYRNNPMLRMYDSEAGYRFYNLDAPEDADRVFVILTFSGGGTRAAALSYGVLETLKRTRFESGGHRRSLLDEVDVISSVSGGSFTAAYYGLFRDDIFVSYPERFLYRNIQGDLIGQMMNPVNWYKLLSSKYSRIDLAADFYNRKIFDEKCYRDLIMQRRRPMVIINATDMSIGRLFNFTQEQFDPICSDLAGLPVAQAVAASSCFPVAFPPITLNNYAGSCSYEEPGWVRNAIKDLQVSPQRYARAWTLQSYLDADARPYLHLLDGGLSDNLGLRGPLDSLESIDSGRSILRLINQGKVDHVVFIVVDARTKASTRIDQNASPPGLGMVLSRITTIPVDNSSTDVVQDMRDTFYQFVSHYRDLNDFRTMIGKLSPDAPMPFNSLKAVEFYPVYISFDLIADTEKRDYFQSMATSFHLPDQQVTDLIAVACELLEQCQAFQQLKAALKADTEQK